MDKIFTDLEFDTLIFENIQQSGFSKDTIDNIKDTNSISPDILDIVNFEKEEAEAVEENTETIEAEVTTAEEATEKIEEIKSTPEQFNTEISSEIIPTNQKIDCIKHIVPTRIKTSNEFLNKSQEVSIKKAEEKIKEVKSHSKDFPYIKSKLLTPAELQLYHFMINNLDNSKRICIVPKVRLGDIIEVDPYITLSKTPFYKISSKHVDYLICEEDTMDTICVVELDDYTHDTVERKENDKFKEEALRAAGIETLRITCKIATLELKDIEKIDDFVYNHFAPKCPYCGKSMVLRRNKETNDRFFACIDNSECRHTINIDSGEKLV